MIINEGQKQRRWTHLGLVDDQTHERGHQRRPGQRRCLPPLQLGSVRLERGRLLRHSDRVGVTQGRHVVQGSAAAAEPERGNQWEEEQTVSSGTDVSVALRLDTTAAAAWITEGRSTEEACACAWVCVPVRVFLLRCVHAHLPPIEKPVLHSSAVGNINTVTALSNTKKED